MPDELFTDAVLTLSEDVAALAVVAAPDGVPSILLGFEARGVRIEARLTIGKARELQDSLETALRLHEHYRSAAGA